MAQTIQFGRSNPIAASKTTITFPNAFSKTPVVLVTLETATSGGLRNYEIQKVTNTSFDIRFSVMAMCVVNWLAITD